MFDYDNDKIDYLLNHVNGVLFPGGEADLWNDTVKTGFSNVTKKAIYIFEKVIEKNN